MAGLNKVILIGNLGKDPELKKLESGNAVCNFSIATSETYKNKAGEKVTETQWHNIVLWGKLAEIAAQYLKKGSQCCIIGKITQRSWDDKDGVKRYMTEIIGNEMTMLGGKKDAEQSTSVAVDAHPDGVDDLPF